MQKLLTNKKDILEYSVVVLLLVTSSVLNFFSLQKIGYGNQYYAAAIKSMLTSWSNFFFISFDPAGFVTLDKPPVAFWLDAISVKILGFNAFGLLLPQILSAVVSVFLVYYLVKKTFGGVAGLMSAFVMTIASPVLIIVARNNTPDSILILFLLLASAVFLKSMQEKKLSWLLVSATLIGVGFNTKMLQAYLVVPAFIVVYLFAASYTWKRKIVYLGAACIVLLLVSFSWIGVVQLVPAENRPYIGSSQDNSALSLAFGYNGLQRLLGQNQNISSALSSENTAQQGGPGGGFSQGEKSLLRLFQANLGSQAGWLIPFAFISSLLYFARRKIRLPLDEKQRDSLLWGVWLLTAFIFFSVAGFFHEYYLAMLVPPIAALCGIGIAYFLTITEWKWKEYLLLSAALLLTAAGQISILQGFASYATWIVPVLIVTMVLFIIVLFISMLSKSPRIQEVWRLAVLVAYIATLIAPGIWSIYTAGSVPNATLPTAGPSVESMTSRGTGNFADGQNLRRPDGGQRDGGVPPQNAGAAMPQPPQDGQQNNFGMRNQQNGGLFSSQEVNPELITYLSKNQGDTEYFLTTTNSNTAAPYILATDKKIIAIGGFNGNDPVLTLEKFKQLVDSNVIRFFIAGGFGGGMQNRTVERTDYSQQVPNGIPGVGWGGNQEIIQWVNSTCSKVSSSDIYTESASNQVELYDCKGAQ